MAMVVSNQRRIYYRYEGEKGAFLLLHHGLFGSHRDWYDAGYIDALASNFRLIIPDARGHGRSDHPQQPEDYRLEQFADDVIAIMEELRIRNLHFLGYSFGAMVGMQVLLRHPERVRITMMAGESPFITEDLQGEWREMAARIRQEGFTTVLEKARAERLIITSPQREEVEGEQQAALSLLEALGQVSPRGEQERISVNSPVALFIGTKDRASDRMQEARKAIHRARFVSIPGQDHVGLFTEREALLAEVLRLVYSGKKTDDASSDSQAYASERPEQGPRKSVGATSAESQKDSRTRGRARKSEEASKKNGPELSQPPGEGSSQPRQDDVESASMAQKDHHPDGPKNEDNEKE